MCRFEAAEVNAVTWDEWTLQCFCVFGVKNVYAGLVALSEVIVTISNAESSLEDEKRLNMLILTQSIKGWILISTKLTFGLLK